MDKKVVSINHKNKIKPALSKREAQEKINALAKDSSNIIIPNSGHAEERMIRDFTRKDIIEILAEGVVKREPKLGKHGDWSYTVEIYRFRGNRDAAVATIILKENKLFVKTVFWVD